MRIGLLAFLLIGLGAAGEEHAIVVTAKQLASDYAENDVAAARRYKGRRVDISGPVDSVQTYGNEVVIMLDGTASGIECSVDAAQPKSEDSVATLRAGSKVRLRCIVGPKILIPTLTKCRFL